MSYLRCFLVLVCNAYCVVVCNAYCVVFLLCFSSSWVSYVSSFSELSIVDGSFGIL